MRGDKYAGLYEGLLTRNLDIVKGYFLKKNFDWVNCVDGFERLGKSTLAVKECLYVDPTFDLSRVCFTPEQYEGAALNARKDTAVLYDEAITGLFSKEAQSRINVTLNKLFAIIGSKRLFHCVVMPNFLRLDKNIATRRVMSLEHVYWRGKFRFYSRKRASIIAEASGSGKGAGFRAQSPNFNGTFPDQHPDEFPWRKYELAKQRHLKRYFAEHGISRDVAGSDLAAVIGDVKRNLASYLTKWGAKTIIDKELLMHDFNLSNVAAIRVKKLLQRDLSDRLLRSP